MRLRPRARRFDRTLRPPVVFIRARKPCTRARRRFFGWYVRFTIGPFSPESGKQHVNERDQGESVIRVYSARRVCARRTVAR